MRWVLAFLGLMLLTACGQTGPLYLPAPVLPPLQQTSTHSSS
ncbi:MAG: lipoprotein [Gammaproteobacteria bacterium]